MIPACAGPVVPDLVITNARVFTNDTARPWAEAVAIKGQSLVAVGPATELLASAKGATRVIDAGGRVLVPGFNDARVDLPLEPPTPASLAALDRAAVAAGVTSVQVVAGGPMRSLVEAARQAQRQARWRVIRSPMDGERPQDEEPFLPPDPGVRLAAKGVSWTIDADATRTQLDAARLSTVVGWAYGAEDPIIFLGGQLEPVTAMLGAMEGRGLPAVWQRKRPRLDLSHAVPGQLLPRIRELGFVVTWLPVATQPQEGLPSIFISPGSSASTADSELVLAGGSGGPPMPMAVFAALASYAQTPEGSALTRQEAVRAMTWGSAYAEKTEREKGWLGPGALADIAVLSDDIFTVAADRMAAITSVLTLVGGTIVHDSGVLTK